METIQTTALSLSAIILERVLGSRGDCCHSNSSEKPSANTGVKNLKRSKIKSCWTWGWRWTQFWWVLLNDLLTIGKGTGWIGNQRKNRDHPDYRIVKISLNTEQNPGALRRFAVSHTPQVRKNRKKYNNYTNYNRSHVLLYSPLVFVIAMMRVNYILWFGFFVLMAYQPSLIFFFFTILVEQQWYY